MKSSTGLKYKYVPTLRGIKDPRRSDKKQLKALAPSMVRRLRDAAVARMEDERWATQTGYLFLTGKVGAPQMAAGMKWNEVASCYRWALQGPAASAKSTSLERGLHSHAVDVDSDAGLREAGDHAEAVRDFDAAAAVVLDLFGQNEMHFRGFREVVEHDHAVAGHEDLIRVDQALTALALHFGLMYEPKGKRAE